MSRLTDLIGQLKKTNNQLAVEIEKEVKVLSSRREFGLNFERHKPEVVDLPLRKVRKGDKVRILPERLSSEKVSEKIWFVQKITKKGSLAKLKFMSSEAIEECEILVENLAVVAEFRDPIYPGLVSTGKIEKVQGKPFHTIINAENYHALKALTFTHKGKVDVIYIDPPYNTGAKDWKYNNDYVESEDTYRHSKWLAFMERRLKIGKDLLNPESSVLIVTIDEKEYLRLGLLLEQTFQGSKIQMITALTNPKGVARGQEFYRVDEYIFIVYIGSASVHKGTDPMIKTGKDEDKEETKESDQYKEPKKKKVRWGSLLRSGTDAKREDRKNQFYPIFLNKEDGSLHSIGESLLPVTESRKKVQAPKGTVAVWPIRKDGSEGRWQVGYQRLSELFDLGYVSIGRFSGTEKVSFGYITENLLKQIDSGSILINGRDDRGVVILEFAEDVEQTKNPKTMWNKTSHSASEYGTTLLREILPQRSFPFPKSLYAVEDVLRFFTKDKPSATVLDFFSGSGTTAHATMRLNKQDNGQRRSILITNNEVSAKEQSSFIKKGLRPGDKDWEKFGICEFITKPRIKAVIQGKTPEGKEIKGNYKFDDEFPISDGFDENAEFFNLTYESPISVNHNLAFERIAPLLWMYAGSKGDRIDIVPKSGWEIADCYGVLIDLDKSLSFCNSLKKRSDVNCVFIVTNDERRFQSVSKRISPEIETIRLFESYLKNFQFMSGE